MDELNPYAALMARKAQLLAQEQQAMQPQMPQQPMPPQGQQAQFSGYGMTRPQMSPQQVQQLAALLQRRQQ